MSMRRTSTTVIVPVLVSCIWLIISCASDTRLRTQDSTEKVVKSIDKTIPDLMSKQGIESLSMAVIRDGRAEVSRHYSALGGNTIKQVSADVVYQFASLGKPVFAYICIQLERDKIINLDLPVHDYNNELLSEYGVEARNITARMILNHTSGIPGDATVANASLKHAPGTAFHYSSAGYNKLQTLVESLTGASLEELGIKYVFAPLKMYGSTFVFDSNKDEMESGPVEVSKGEGKQPVVSRPASAASSFHSSVNDYARFLEMILNEEAGAVQTQMENAFKVAERISWTIGWGVQQTEPNASLWHWGSNPGYRSFVVAYPVEKIAVVIVANSDTLFKVIEPMIKTAIGGQLPAYHWF